MNHVGFPFVVPHDPELGFHAMPIHRIERRVPFDQREETVNAGVGPLSGNHSRKGVARGGSSRPGAAAFGVSSHARIPTRFGQYASLLHLVTTGKIVARRGGPFRC